MPNWGIRRLSKTEDFHKIGASTYLLHPFQSFSLCLEENWLEKHEQIKSEFPPKMKRVLLTREKGVGDILIDTDPIPFETEETLPDFMEQDGASVYFFSSVHFEGETLGYAVLQRSLAGECALNLVYRNWLRFVNNALEMVKAKRQLVILSIRDGMTGLYNRRGMETKLREMLDGARQGDSLFAAVIDMDGLKRINDNYGHGEGDFGIRTVSSAVAHGTKPNEICVRASGDEFYVLGVGNYKAEDLALRKKDITDVLSEIMNGYQKPYKVSVSIGCVLREISETLNIDAVITLADEEMYREKTQKKLQRKD